MTQVVVIGAGVIGLQSTITLAEAGYNVTVIAQYWPGDESIDYTSPWAGAIWRSHSMADQVETCKWDVQSYTVWSEIAEHEPEKAKSMGISRCPLTVYSETSGPTEPFYASHVQGYQNLGQIESAQPTFGHSFTSIAVNPDTYLTYLQERAKQLGATFIRKTLPVSEGLRSALECAIDCIDSPFHEEMVIVNCTGISARRFCSDQDVYPIRGQTFLGRFNPPLAREILLWEAKNTVTYMVPRPGTDLFVFGGTKDQYNSDPTPTPIIREDIIGRCKRVLAIRNVQDIEVEMIKEQVGLRPGRKNGIRIEVEDVKVGQEKVLRVVHNYGHAGAGYQLSLGSAEKVLGLVREILRT